MGINVKNERVEAEIRLLAEKLGVGLTEAIDAAVTAKLAELEAARQAEIARKTAAIEEIQERLRPFLTPEMTSGCSDLYNEFGEPA
jgi:hypothetical protein